MAKVAAPHVMPRLADGTLPGVEQLVEHADGTRGPIVWTVPRRGCDRPTTPADWRTLVRTPSGRALSRPTRELRPC